MTITFGGAHNRGEWRVALSSLRLVLALCALSMCYERYIKPELGCVHLYGSGSLLAVLLEKILVSLFALSERAVQQQE